MKAMLKKMMLGVALMLAGMVGAAATGTLVTFSSTGPDAYPDGATVVDGEYYALAWAEDAAKLVMGTDGTVAEGRVLAKVSVAEDGRCPPVNVKLDDATASACKDGAWGVFLLDTRGSTGDALTISSATRIANATVEVASNGFLSYTKFGPALLSAPGITDGVTDNPAAAIGSTGYATLADAIAAVPTDGTETTITMLAGETIAADAGITIAAGKNVVLDLNGQTVQMAAVSADERWLIKNEGTLTVKDSAENGKLLMSATGQASTAIRKSTIKNMGALTVESGTIELTYSGTNKEEPTAIMNDASDRATSLTVKGGTVVNSANRGMGVYLAVNDTNATVFDVQGGRVEGFGAAVRYYFDDRNLTDAKLTFNMSNGTVHGRGMYGVQGMTTSSKDWNSISFDISGGTISCAGLLNRKSVISPLQGTVSISGGTFAGDVYIYGHALEITDGDFAGSVTLHRTKESLESASISGGQFSSGLTIAETTADNTTNPYYNAKFITGGIYGTAPEARNVVDEYAVIDNTDSSTQGDYPKAIGGAAASVTAEGNTTYYATLNDAIAAANAANVDEITILNGATESPDADWTVSDGKLIRRSYYNVWVGGTQIAADNSADVFGDGKVSYDDATKTLTLNGYTYSGTGYGDSAVYIGDVGGATFNIVVAGENSLTSTAAYGYAIRSVGTGAVTVTGSGSDPSLALTVPSAYDTGYAVSIKGTSATFKDLSMSVTGYLGIVVNGNNASGDALTIDNCDVVFDGTAIDQAIWVYNPMGDGTVSIENGSSLTGQGAILVYGYGTSAGDANLSITDSTVNLTGATTASASGSSRHAIEVLSNVGDSVLTIDNSTVTVTASNGLNPNGNGPDGINVGSQKSANGKGVAKIDIKNGSVVTATGNANGVNLFTWGDSSNVNLCGAELSVVDSTLNASATHATGGHYGIVAYAYQKGDTSVVFENSTVNASAPASAGIYVGAGEDFNADVGNLSYEAIDSDVTMSGPYGLVVSAVSAGGNNTSVLQTVDISGGSFTCNGLLFVYGDDGENTASVSMSDVTAQIGTTTATDEPVLGTVTTGELSIDSGEYTILHAADLDAFDAADGNISGGNFNEPVPEELCADTYIPTPQDPVTGKYTVKVGSYVAQIGDVKYETFAEAIVAAEAYKTANGDYPVITVLDATAEQTNLDWKIVDGKLVHKVYVAQIGTTKYESLASAVAAANAGDTIEMIADDRLSSELVIGRSVTITGAVDENGKPLYTIYGKPTDNYNVDVFVKNASSAIDVTIQNVNISEFGHQYKTSTGNAALYVSRSTHADTHVLVSNVTFSAYNNYAIIAPQGHLEVVDCAIDGDKDSSYGTFATGGIWSGDMFDDLPSSTVSVVRTSIINTDSNMPGVTGYAIDARAGSTVTVTDCTITNVHDGIAAAASQESGDGEASVSVSGTTVTASRNALAITGNPQIANTVLAYLEVTSGMFAGAVTIPDEFVDDGIIEISGGVFDRAVPEDYCATGYIPTANTDAATSAAYPYTVGTAVAQIVRGGNVVAKYESLVAAYNASESGDTIELLGDDRSLSADDNAELTITKSIIITGPVDANGDPLYTIYGKNDSNGYNDIFIRAGASDTVTISNVNVAQFGNQASLVMDVAPIYVGGGNAAKVVLDNVHVSEFLRIGVMMSGSGEFEVKNCYIDGARERSDTCSYGIEVHRGAHGVIADTTIENVSSTSEGWGAVLPRAGAPHA